MFKDCRNVSSNKQINKKNGADSGFATEVQQQK